MNIFEHNGEVLLQRYEGNRQLASALADSAQVLFRRLTEVLAKALDRIPGTYPF